MSTLLHALARAARWRGTLPLVVAALNVIAFGWDVTHTLAAVQAIFAALHTGHLPTSPLPPLPIHIRGLREGARRLASDYAKLRKIGLWQKKGKSSQ